MSVSDKEYVVILQCHIVKERCSGFLCEKALHDRSGGFSDYPSDRALRVISMTCGGCCGKATLRKLNNLTKLAKAHDGIAKDKIVVQLSSCITKSNYHSPRCPNVEYIKTLVARAGLDCREDTRISELAETRRAEGAYE